MSLIRIYLAERILAFALWVCPKDKEGTDFIAMVLMYTTKKLDQLDGRI